MQSAFVKIMRFYASKDKESLPAAIAMFGGLSASSDAQIRGKSELGAAEALLLMGNALEAHQKYKSAAQTYAGQPYIRGIALYGIAVCSQELQKPDEAVAQYDAFSIPSRGPASLRRTPLGRPLHCPALDLVLRQRCRGAILWGPSQP